MEGYDSSSYGNRIAEVYDRRYEELFDTRGAVGFLADLAGSGVALELGIGTGRIALPLAERGVALEGVDASEAMIAKLRSKPGGSAIPVHVEDFSELDLPGPYGLVYVVFNTFFGLTSQEDQVRCFREVARLLTEGGAFVIEAFVPDPTLFDRHQRVDVQSIAMDEVELSVSRHDPAAQRVDSHHVLMTEGGVKLYPVRIRYAWPAELDLMARLAGLGLRERWADWRRSPFTAASTGHVSVYERA